MIVIALIATLAILSGGIIATRINDGDGANAGDVGAVATATTGTGIEPTTSGTQGGAASDQPGETPEGSTNGERPTETGGVASTEVAPVNTGGEEQPPLLSANPPVRGAPIYDTQAVETYYSEWYQFENFVISWRQGAFPAERADEVAAQARKGL